MKPEEIANKIVDEFHVWALGDDQNPALLACLPTLKSRIRQAIADERERCAKIADKWASNDVPTWDERHSCSWDECCTEQAAHRIAAAIRSHE